MNDSPQSSNARTAQTKSDPAAICVTTLGCRLNQADGDALEAEARRRGYRVVQNPHEATVNIINSCSITHQADRDSRKVARRLKREAPAASIVMTGCFASTAPHTAAAMSEVDAVFGNNEKHTLLGSLTQEPVQNLSSEPLRFGHSGPADVDIPLSALLNNRTQKITQETADRFPPPNIHPHRSRPFLKIQDGCDYKCSFCIVPQARGPSISLGATELRARLRNLVDAGHGEINITGVHLGTYGRDLMPRHGLRRLLEQLVQELGSARLRLGSLDPHELDRDFIDFLADNQEHICRHLHLPVQSGDDAVLAAMRRAHRTQDLKQVTELLVHKIPGVCIGSDIIVGFPTADHAAFNTTRDFLADLPLAYLHVFSYSPRTGTTALKLGDTIAHTEKAERNAELRTLAEKKWKIFIASQASTPLPAMVYRQANTTDTGTYPMVRLLSDNYIPMQLPRSLVTGRSGQWLEVQLPNPLPKNLKPTTVLDASIMPPELHHG